MCKPTKDFTIIENDSKRISFKLKSFTNPDSFKQVENIFTKSMNQCKGVIMKKEQLVIQM